MLLWLGDPEQPIRGDAILVQSKADLAPPATRAAFRVSAVTGEGLDALADTLVERARGMLPGDGEVAANARQRAQLAEAAALLREAAATHDPLILAELLRATRACFDRLTGRAGVEDMLDLLFGRFCIGK
jgi:tRNA modification GTPase